MVRRRSLHPEEKELWQSVARTAQPLRPHAPEAPAPIDLPASLARPHPPEPPPLPTFRIGERSGPGLASRQPSQPPSAPLRMDAKAFARMSRGKLLPEARIDLHGMTLAEAHPELVRFILNAQAQAMRLVLVITGKGRKGNDDGPIPQRMGVLRHQVPQWLARPPLGPVVLQVAEAHLRHGGAGALYVYLRRSG